MVMSVFTTALAVHAKTVARRRRAPVETPMDAVLLTLATFAIADVVAHERIAHFVREPFVTDTVDDHGGQAKGEGMRFVIGELLTCSRCMGSWSALGLASLSAISPVGGRAVIGVFAAAGANDILQATFKATAAAADRLTDGA